MTHGKSRYGCAPSRAGKIAALAVVALGLLKAASVRAEDYKELPTDVRGWTSVIRLPASNSVTQMLLDNAALDVEPFDKFFAKEMFPQFTLYKVDPANPAKDQTNVIVIDPKDEKDELNKKSRLPKMRDEFVKRFLNQGKNQVAFEHLQDLAIESMSEIALHNYHPLARYNAVLLLTSLHEYGVPDKPYPKTWKVFVDCLDSIGPVKVAGMNAVLKNIKTGIPADQQARLVEKLEKILADKVVPAGETPEGHDWIRRKAMDVMLAIGDPAINAKVVNDLAAILNDPKSSVDLCCAAAKMLGSIRSSALGTQDLPLVAANIGRAALVATRAELVRAEERAFAAPLPVVNPQAGGFGPGGRRAGPGAPADPGAADADTAPSEQFIDAALLRGQLTNLAAAFNGPGGGLDAAGKGVPAVANVKGALNALIAICDPKAPDYAVLKQQIEKGADVLEGKVGKAGGPAPAAAGGKAAGGSDGFDTLDKAAPAVKNSTPVPAK